MGQAATETRWPTRSPRAGWSTRAPASRCAREAPTPPAWRRASWPPAAPAGSSHCTSTTACAPTRPRTRPHAPPYVGSWGSSSWWSGPSCPAGATSRRTRAMPATRRPSACAPSGGSTGSPPATLAPTSPRPSSTASPPRRAGGRCSGLPERRGKVVRPLLGASRAEVRGWVRAAGLPFRDDPTNAEPVYARNRIRSEVMPVLGDIGPAAEATIAETRAELAEEAAVLDRLAGEALASTGAAAAGAIPSADLERLDPAVARLALRELAERAAGRPGPARPRPGGRDPPAGRRARGRRGRARRRSRRPRRARARALHGRRGGGAGRGARWRCREAAGSASGRSAPRSRSGTRRRPPARARPGWTAAPSGPELVVRAWRDGDRIRPVGLGGSKSLQDLFTDRKVPALASPQPARGRGGRADRLDRGAGGVRGVRRAGGGLRGGRPDGDDSLSGCLQPR